MLTDMQREIMEKLWFEEEFVVELDPAEFPYIYVIRKPGQRGGTYYPSTPIVGLLKREILVVKSSYPNETLWLNPNKRLVEFE